MKSPSRPVRPYPPGTKHPEGDWHGGAHWLTWEEREELTRKANENNEYFRKAFAHLRPEHANKDREET